MQKIEVTKRIADTGAMAIVRVKTVERGFEIAQGCLDWWNRLSGDQLYPSECR